MKILSIGDIHGRNKWKTIIQGDEDLVIFVGDYCDAYEVEDHYIIQNLINIINYKKNNMDKVILLLGNHECQYLFNYTTHGCSGFRSSMYEGLHQILNDNKNLFIVSYQIDNYIWSHAGISEHWYKKFLQIAHPDLEGNLSQKINDTFNSSKEWIICQVGESRGGLRGDWGGPLWADAAETMLSPMQNFIQIVGHTPQPYIKTIGNYTYIDVLQHSTVGYILEINKDE